MSSKRRNDGAGPGSKKQRFDHLNPSKLAADYDDDDDQDAILELDEIGKGSSKSLRRSAVKLDGYDSDSSTDNFDQRAEARGDDEDDGRTGGKGWSASGKNNRTQDEEENDMFADVDDDMADGDGVDTNGARTGRSKKTGKGKEVQFMDAAEIVGQIDTSHSGGHVQVDFGAQLGDGKGKGKSQAERDVESSSESGDDEDRAEIDPELEDAEELGAGAKKRHAPKLDAFNLRQETAEEGQFDEAGNFVRKAGDQNARFDNWMQDYNKKDMRKAHEAHERRAQALRRSHAENDSVLTSDLLSRLITRLVKTETPLEALQRLGIGKTKKKTHPAWKKKRSVAAGEMDIDVESSGVDESHEKAEVLRKEAVEAVTDAADKLMSRGQEEIYDTERELLVRQYKRETGEDWIEPADTAGSDGQATAMPAKQWEYRWADARDGGQRHGPYDGTMMEAWVKAGYFGQDVEYRPVGKTGWRKDVDFL